MLKMCLRGRVRSFKRLARGRLFLGTLAALFLAPPLTAQGAALDDLEVRAYSVAAEHAVGELALVSDLWQVVRVDASLFYIIDRSLQHVVSLVLSEDLREAQFAELGRSGQGPGEFRNPGPIGLRPNEDLWVVDPNLGRVTTFTVHGPEVADLPARYGARSGGLLATRGVFTDGSLLLVEELSLLTMDRTSLTTTGLFRSNADGSEIDSISDLDWSRFWLRVFLGQGGEFHFFQPWSLADRWALGDRGQRLVMLRQRGGGSGIVVDVTAFGPDAREIARFKHAFEEEALTKLSDDIIDAWVDGHLDSSLGERFPSRRAGRKAFREGLFLPEYLPPFKSLHVGYDETTWVELHGLPNEPVRWLVLDLELRPVKVVEIGAGLEVFSVSNDLIVAVRRNAFDDPLLVFLRP